MEESVILRAMELDFSPLAENKSQVEFLYPNSSLEDQSRSFSCSSIDFLFNWQSGWRNEVILIPWNSRSLRNKF